MIVKPIKTNVVHAGDDLLNLITKHVEKIPEKSILVVTSKIVSLSEGRVVPKIENTKEERNKIVREIADYFIPPHMSKYRIMLTRYMGMLMIDAGVDVSNSDNQYTLLPNDPQKSVNEIWEFVRTHYDIEELGIVMTDSFPALPLIWGTVSIPLAHCGFVHLKNYQGRKDIFGWKMHLPIVNLAQGVAVAAGLEMGEGDEQTPLAMVSEVKDIKFQQRVPSTKEINAAKVDIVDDLFAPFLNSVNWEKGRLKDDE